MTKKYWHKLKKNVKMGADSFFIAIFAHYYPRVYYY